MIQFVLVGHLLRINEIDAHKIDPDPVFTVFEADRFIRIVGHPVYIDGFDT